MMKKLRALSSFFFIVIFLVMNYEAMGQFRIARKPQVLIYGNNIAAYTAAIQSAKSQLNTLWITGSNSALVPELTQNSIQIRSNENMDAGLWLDLLVASYKGSISKDSAANIVKLQTNPALLLQAIEDEIKKYGHLEVRRETIRSIKSNKSDYKIQSQSGSTWDIHSLVDASSNQDLSSLLESKGTLSNPIALPPESKLNRNGVGIWKVGNSIKKIGLHEVLNSSSNGNFLSIFKFISSQEEGIVDERERIPYLAQLGQTYGAIAAYLAFFKKDIPDIDLREIQSELLQYNALLNPVLDVNPSDSNFLAIQRISLTFNFYENSENGDVEKQPLFHPEKTVKIENLANELKEYYSRSQIWLLDNHEGPLYMEKFIKLIQQLSQKGKEVEGQIQKAWTQKYKFDGEFSLRNEVTHRQFAVIMDDFCKPFEIKIGLQGQVLR